MPNGVRALLADPRGHVVLVGLMGSGKTTVGRRVAKALGREFVDADHELVARSGRSIADWFADHGESAFRAAESDVLADLLSRRESLVIATGGGVVCSEANRHRLGAADSTVVWLRATPEMLARRVAQKGPKPERPLLADDPLKVLRELAEQRDPWYAEVADLVVDVDPVHQSGEHPKRRLAALVVEKLQEVTTDAAEEER